MKNETAGRLIRQAYMNGWDDGVNHAIYRSLKRGELCHSPQTTFRRSAAYASYRKVLKKERANDR